MSHGSLIAIFGDSNGIGYRPDMVGYYDESTIWPVKLTATLGAHGLDATLVNDSVPGRAFDGTRADAGMASDFPRYEAFVRTCREEATNGHVVIFILALGTNDFGIGRTAAEILASLDKYLTYVRRAFEDSRGSLRLYYMVHPGIRYERLKEFKIPFENIGDTVAEYTGSLGPILERHGCVWIDLTAVVLPKSQNVVGKDGVHFTPAGHAAIASYIASVIVRK